MWRSVSGRRSRWPGATELSDCEQRPTEPRNGLLGRGRAPLSRTHLHPCSDEHALADRDPRAFGHTDGPGDLQALSADIYKDLVVHLPTAVPP